MVDPALARGAQRPARASAFRQLDQVAEPPVVEELLTISNAVAWRSFQSRSSLMTRSPLEEIRVSFVIGTGAPRP